MIAGLYLKLAVIGITITLLTAGAWKAYSAGKRTVQAEWNADKLLQTTAMLKASEEARAKEQVLITKTQKVSHDYQTEKKRRAADAVVSADKLRDLTAALAAASSANPTTTSGDDDPRTAIINQCAGALSGMDDYAKEVAGKAIALQGFIREVCVAK